MLYLSLQNRRHIGLWSKEDRTNYLKNAYRVLLTRARQGMVIVVPRGDSEDPTRNPLFYDATFDYLKEIGFTIL
jgi:superfamily I DNA and/or RNA helicase